jgi:hypothetical protein
VPAQENSSAGIFISATERILMLIACVAAIAIASAFAMLGALVVKVSVLSFILNCVAAVAVLASVVAVCFGIWTRRR